VTPPPSETELLARVVAGDHGAFDEVMRLHEDRVFSVCYRIMGDRERALDATQDTFLTVFRKVDQFQGKSALSTWIYRIAVNTCYDTLRKSKRRPSGPMPDRLDPEDPVAESLLASAAVRPEIEAALATLPVEFRNAIVLADMHGLSLPETAEVLDIPIGTVKSRVFRGRRLLAQRLGNQNNA
jgi:RNA polymerase sigma-70 factor, ECF subfamily